ncbi:MucR family transcriptional regulator [Geomonas subterranea]|uniref:MucR family transcriptional regulator n=1 Tax=Geomonas subterranea TaxID=2847989 RepID=UPI001CD7BD63|nr:MucR family transcriptional regulator [Geomonas fuzhouensis]
MATLVELASQIVTAQATSTPMTTEEVVTALSTIHTRLKQLESGVETAQAAPDEQEAKISAKEAFKKNEVICMECGKGGFKTLARHLAVSHDMKPGEYKKKHGIPAKQSLAAKSYSDSRRKMAVNAGLAENLVKARAARMAKLEKKAAPAAAKAPAKAKAAKAPKTVKAPKAAKKP